MSTIAETRLLEERKKFRKDRPFGFVARPNPRPDGSTNIKQWDCIIPGKEGTIWEGGHYPVTMAFPDGYPADPPVCSFPAGFFHPNVYPDGHVCLSILNKDRDLGGSWAPSIGIKEILIGIQELLNNPNNASPAQDSAYRVLKTNKADYERRVREQAKRYPAQDAD